MSTIFKEEDFGQYIAQELSTILVDYTSHPERRAIALEYDVSDSIVRDVSNGRVKLSSYSVQAIEAVADLALKNADKEAKKAARSRRYLKKLKKSK